MGASLSPAVKTVPVRSRYDVFEELASGGMGTVHRAFDRLGEREVAYKRLKVTEEPYRPRLTARFRFEYDSLVRFNHPNIVEAYDFGFDELGPYYTMELLAGMDLARSASLTVRDACRVLRDVASALALLHARRLVHRDISPRNVRLSEDRRAKLIDFGALSPFGKSTDVIGTPAFVAPEGLRLAELDQRSDLYGLGALAYWLLTGRTHIRAKTMEDVLEAVQLPMVPPSRFCRDIPAALDELLVSLLRAEPSARPTSAADVIARLTASVDLPPEEDSSRVARSYLKHTPLQGRQDALRQTREAVHRVVGGSGGLILMEAERGLGRTALLNQVAVDAQLEGVTVLRALGTPGAAFGVARGLLAQAEKVMPGLPELPKSWITRLQEPERAHETKTAVDASAAVERIVARLEAAVFDLADAMPVVLMVDDAEAMDGESVAFFASLVQALHAHPLLVILSADARSAWQHAPGYGKLRLGAERVPLSALTAREMRDLVASMLGAVPNYERVAAWLHDQTGGNPSDCIDLTRRLLDARAIRYTVGTFTLPYDVETVWKESQFPRSDYQRAPILGPDAELALSLALHSGPLSVTELATSVGRPPAQVLAGLERLVHLGVALREGDMFSTAGASLRRAIVSSSSEISKRDTHVALARALRARGAEGLATRLLIAEHLIAAGGSEASEGATLVATLGLSQLMELAVGGSGRQVLENGLTVLKGRGLADTDCVGILVALCVSAFFGNMASLRKYFDRAMRALAEVTGLGLATRLSRVFGGILGLSLGLTVGFLRHRFQRHKVNRYSYKDQLLLYSALPSIAAGAFSSAWDSRESYRASTWLDVFANAVPGSAPSTLREFCRATADIGAGRINSALERYEGVRKRAERGIPGMYDGIRRQLHAASLFGVAQALVSNASPRALEVVGLIDEPSALFAFYVSGVRASHHIIRGEIEKAIVHRRTAESLAFRGGVSWSALSLLTTRWVIACVLTRDVVELSRALADLELLATLSPGLRAVYRLTEAHLDALNGRGDRALAVYEEVLDTELARSLPTYAVERGFHARVLNALGRHADARRVCQETARETEKTGHDSIMSQVILTNELAIAEGRLGDPVRGGALLPRYLDLAREYGNPLWSGMLHETAALLATLAGDRPRAASHTMESQTEFASTGNPQLMHQAETLEMDRPGAPLDDAVGSNPDLLDSLSETACEPVVPASDSTTSVPPRTG